MFSSRSTPHSPPLPRPCPPFLLGPLAPGFLQPPPAPPPAPKQPPAQSPTMARAILALAAALLVLAGPAGKWICQLGGAAGVQGGVGGGGGHARMGPGERAGSRPCALQHCPEARSGDLQRACGLLPHGSPQSRCAACAIFPPRVRRRPGARPRPITAPLPLPARPPGAPRRSAAFSTWAAHAPQCRRYTSHRTPLPAPPAAAAHCNYVLQEGETLFDVSLPGRPLRLWI